MLPPTPRIVLDTNVVLDWLLFDDDNGRQVGQAIVDGTLAWVGTSAMRDEHFEVLGRTALTRWAPDAVAHRRVWDAHCRLCAAPSPRTGSQSIRPADPDDQIFVDLALSEGAAWLISRDRALLDLTIPMRAHGVVVVTPAAWTDLAGTPSGR